MGAGRIKRIGGLKGRARVVLIAVRADRVVLVALGDAARCEAPLGPASISSWYSICARRLV